jgi:NAD(P)-dependent dehydrogenase (short-subunit alcohol dehydrogenase family)
MSSSHVLAVFGSGPGIGSATAKLFAKSGRYSKIAMISRDPSRLDQEAAAVREAGGNSVDVTSFPTDLSNIDQLRKTLQEIGKLGTLGSVFYNVSLEPNPLFINAT